MKSIKVETLVGMFILLGIICVGYLTIKLGKLEIISDNTYHVFARFQSVSGLNPNAHVEMAGVKIGRVIDIKLDRDRLEAVIEMKIRKDVSLTDDVIASVRTAGLIGDKYIKISPGGSDVILKPGDLITETESALDLEELISKYVFGEM